MRTLWIAAVPIIGLAMLARASAEQLVVIGDPPDWVGHGPPPPGWEPRDTPTTRYVAGLKPGRLVVPRKPDGACMDVSMIASDGSANDFGDFSATIDYTNANDGSCD